MNKDSWIDKAIEKQQRDMKDVPRYMLDAYAGDYQINSEKKKDKK